MTKEQIIAKAKTLNAKEFTQELERSAIVYEILDMDNIMDHNDGCLNLYVTGLPSPNLYKTEFDEGESLLFVDGKFYE